MICKPYETFFYRYEKRKKTCKELDSATAKAKSQNQKPNATPYERENKDKRLETIYTHVTITIKKNSVRTGTLFFLYQSINCFKIKSVVSRAQAYKFENLIFVFFRLVQAI